MEKKKVTKHAVGDVYFFLDEFLSEHKKENFKITGIEFSNLGAQGREPLFDISHSNTRDIFAYWKDENKNCVVISTPAPGYEIKAPESLYHFFGGKRHPRLQINYLDVTHLDVSDTTDFTYCFLLFGYSSRKKTKDAKIIGLETWDVNSGKNFGNMFDKAFPSNKNINLNLSSWRFSQEVKISFMNMFQYFGEQAIEVILDVSGWNTENVDDFDQMFEDFAPRAKIVELKEIEKWRLGAGPISLKYMFANFAVNAIEVKIKGIENWKMHNKMDVSGMFANFAPNSDWYPNLSKWDMKGILPYKHEEFAAGLFFKIREPEWV